MRARTHVIIATAGVGLATLACRGAPRAAPFDAGDVDAEAEGAKLGALLPPTLGSFKATEPATPGSGPGSLIEASRSYADATGKEVNVRIATGDVRSDLAQIELDDGHAFGSDSPTYWRTTSIAGHRARIAEERPVVRSSKCLVRIEPNHVATVRVTPASAGECAVVAASLDLKAIIASGGVPCPPRERR
jgi:hypothetical protein